MSSTQAKVDQLQQLLSPKNMPMSGGNEDLASLSRVSVGGRKRRGKHSRKHGKHCKGGMLHGNKMGGKKSRHNRRKSHKKHKK